ncbi:hypothetical protein J6590_062792 [Homalodisca vitripennis]|nr:hypothetical protein J6590_062792 [Homalodisca vitripennis]
MDNKEETFGSPVLIHFQRATLVPAKSTSTFINHSSPHLEPDYIIVITNGVWSYLCSSEEIEKADEEKAKKKNLHFFDIKDT